MGYAERRYSRVNLMRLKEAYEKSPNQAVTRMIGDNQVVVIQGHGTFFKRANGTKWEERPEFCDETSDDWMPLPQTVASSKMIQEIMGGGD